jgi:TetR/AcrR family transcriptional regulator, transcriptional repressor for nem operon
MYFIPTSWYITPMARPVNIENKKSAKENLLSAAILLIRKNGYNSTTVENICNAAQVTKGTFFHYFASKEDLAVCSADYWSQITAQFFQQAPYHKYNDPLKRIIGYLEFRKKILEGKIPEFTCLAGTMVQETYDSNPKIRLACKQSIFSHAENLEIDIDKAKKLYAPRANWSVKSLALYTQAAIQGSFILAKAGNDPLLALQAIDHLKNYIELLFNKPIKRRK